MPGEGSYRVKGSTLRKEIEYLSDTGRLPTILALLSPEARALVTNPPLASAWIDGALVDEVLAALYNSEGPQAILSMQRQLIFGPIMALLLPVSTGLVRVLGASPAALYSRFAEMTKRNVEGVDYKYTSLSHRSGKMLVRFLSTKPSPP